MRKTKRFTAILLTAVVLGGCGNSGVSQEEYNKIVSERDGLKEELEKKEAESENMVSDFFSDIENVEAFETNGGNRKILNIVCYIEIFSDTEKASEMSKELVNKIQESQTKEWFDYDYIMVDFWSESLGRIMSITINPNDLSKPMQIRNWYEDNGTENSQNNEETVSESETILYEDEKVKISFAGINEKGVAFWVENLTDVNITIQADSVSINGISSNKIMMSDDVAPKSKGKIVAKCDDFSEGTKVETVGGQLTIIDFGESFDSYKATFVNVPIE